MIVTPISQCKTFTCRAAIGVTDVIKEKMVKNAPTHSVIIYKCPKCGRTDRLVAETQTWNGRKEEAEAEADNTEKVIKAFVIDMGLFDTVDELRTLWRSFRNPPPLEKGKDSGTR